MPAFCQYLNKIYRNLSLLDFFLLVYIFLLISEYPHPLYMYITMAWGCLAYLFLCFKCSLLSKKINATFCCCVFFLIYIFIMGYPVGGLLYTSKMFGAAFLQFSCFPIFYYYKKKSNDQKDAFRFILLLITVFFMLYAYYSYTILGVNARRIADHTVEYEELVLGKGYFLAFAISLVGIYIFDRLRYGYVKETGKKIYRGASVECSRKSKLGDDNFVLLFQNAPVTKKKVKKPKLNNFVD